MPDPQSVDRRGCCDTMFGRAHTEGCANSWRPLGSPVSYESRSHSASECAERGCPPAFELERVEDNTPEYTARNNGVYHYDFCIALCISEAAATALANGMTLQRLVAPLVKDV